MFVNVLHMCIVCTCISCAVAPLDSKVLNYEVKFKLNETHMTNKLCYFKEFITTLKHIHCTLCIMWAARTALILYQQKLTFLKENSSDLRRHSQSLVKSDKPFKNSVLHSCIQSTSFGTSSTDN